MAEKSLLISKVQYDEGSSVRPIFCNFQNGKIPEGFEQHMVSQLYRDTDNELLVAVAANKQLYTQKINSNKTHNTFIAIPNSKGTKVRLVAVDYAKLAPHTNDEIDGNTAGISLNTTLEFTDKRAKRMLNEKAKLKQDTESMRDHLVETVAGVMVDEVDLNASYLAENTYFPKIDPEAESLEHVYSLHDLVSEDVLESLTEEAERIFNNSEDDFGTCDFITKILNQFDDINSQRKLTACQIWLYIDCLLRFHVEPAKVIGTKKYKACTYSEVANNDIMQKFTTQGPTSRQRPNIMRDKCLCYLLVLCVLNSNYFLDITLLAAQLHVSMKRVVEFARTMRFTVKGSTVTLQLPLPAAVEVRHGKRK